MKRARVFLQSAVTLAVLALAACAPAPPDIRAQLTRARIDARGQTLMLVEIAGLGQAALLSPAGLNGSVETWRARSGFSLSFDGGVLLSTRGLGNDVMSGEVSGTLAALAAGGSGGGTYERFQTFVDGEGQTVLRAYVCSMSAPVAEPVTIFDITHPTQRFNETCNTRGLATENIYWTAGGIIWKSREWAGPGLGYVEMERLTR